MKSEKIVIAALIVAALMIVPVSMFSNDDAVVSADPDPGLDPGDMINFAALAKYSDYSNQEMQSETLSTKTYNDGEVLFLKNDYTLASEATLTFASGSTLLIVVGQDFKMKATDLASFQFNDGSRIVIAVNETIAESDNVVSEIPFEDDEQVFFKGSIEFTHGSNSMKLVIAEGTVFQDAKADADVKAMMKFESKTTLDVEATLTYGKEIKLSLGVDFKVNATVTSISKGDKSIIKFKGDGSYDIKVDGPSSAESEKKDLKLDVDGDMNLTIGLTMPNAPVELVIKVSNDVSLDVKVTDYRNSFTADTEDDKQMKLYVDGDFGLDISVDDIKKYEIRDDDGNLEAIFTLTGAKASLDIDISKNVADVGVSVDLGKYEVTEYEGAESTTATYKNVEADLNYKATISEAVSFSLATTPIDFDDLTDDLKDIATGGTVVDEYLAAVATCTTSAEIKETASKFFMGKIDGTVNDVLPFDVTGTSAKAKFSIGEINAGGVFVSDASIKAEVSPSVGVELTASVGKVDYSLGSTGRVIVESAKLTATTSENKTVLFDLEFNLTGEMRIYSIDGRMVGNVYVKNFKVKATLAKEFTFTGLTVGTLASTTKGITVSSEDLTLDVEKKQFLIPKTKVSGDYYGAALVRSVEGTYSDVVISDFDLFDVITGLDMTIGSSSVRVTDVYGNYADVESTYDASTKTTTRTISVDGFFWYDGCMTADIDDIVMPTLSDDSENEKFVVSGNLLFNGYSVGESPMTNLTIGAGNRVTIPAAGIDVVWQGDLAMAGFGMKGTPSSSFKTEVEGNTCTFTLSGCAVKYVLSDAAVATKLIAMPGYELTSTGATGFTIGDFTKTEATITDLGATASYTASAVPFSVYIDGKKVTDEARNGTAIQATVASGVSFLFDDNGAIVGSVSGTTWTYTRFIGEGKLDLESIAMSNITYSKGVNEIANSVRFTVPATVDDSMVFKTESKLRLVIDSDDVDEGDVVNIVAKETKYDGKKAFLIKVYTNDNTASELATTVYIPVSGDGFKLMHVDEYGRAQEIRGTLVEIDGQSYLKTDVDDYSIFYATKDTPAYGGSDDGSNLLLYAAIGAAVVIIALAGVFLFMRKKSAA
ncbi:hypothetical protein TALC_00027 [Thermoplasmatales archaeon BRNA1]|nr:hypothetical protein TALC_00027 [Thermoplasmatales archaeon BRNA1]